MKAGLTEDWKYWKIESALGFIQDASFCINIKQVKGRKTTDVKEEY